MTQINALEVPIQLVESRALLVTSKSQLSEGDINKVLGREMFDEHFTKADMLHSVKCSGVALAFRGSPGSTIPYVVFVAEEEKTAYKGMTRLLEAAYTCVLRDIVIPLDSLHGNVGVAGPGGLIDESWDDFDPDEQNKPIVGITAAIQHYTSSHPTHFDVINLVIHDDEEGAAYLRRTFSK